MGWAVGFDENWKRDIGYGVPAICDHEGCNEEIDRGLGYVCGGDLYGGEDGCGLFFCCKHLYPIRCDRCRNDKEPYEPTPDTQEWKDHKRTCPSWEDWRNANPELAANL